MAVYMICMTLTGPVSSTFMVTIMTIMSSGAGHFGSVIIAGGIGLAAALFGIFVGAYLWFRADWLAERMIGAVAPSSDEPTARPVLAEDIGAVIFAGVGVWALAHALPALCALLWNFRQAPPHAHLWPQVSRFAVEFGIGIALVIFSGPLAKTLVKWGRDAEALN